MYFLLYCNSIFFSFVLIVDLPVMVNRRFSRAPAGSLDTAKQYQLGALLPGLGNDLYVLAVSSSTYSDVLERMKLSGVNLKSDPLALDIKVRRSRGVIIREKQQSE